MIYLIGGAARVGKTTLAKMILKRQGIPFDSTDMLWWALKESEPKRNWKSEWEAAPDQFFPYLHAYINHAIKTLPDYVVEGDTFFPSHAAELMKKFPIKVVFLGSSNMNLADIKKYSQHNNWVDHLEQKDQEPLPAKLMADSAMFEREAKKFGFPYFDVAEQREEKMEAAYSALFPIK
jgi:hypothetical protein